MSELPKVTLFSKNDCGLCREAESLLRRLASKRRFDIEVVDIEGDIELNRRYWLRIPVIAIAGEEVAAAPIDEQALKKSLSRLLGHSG